MFLISEKAKAGREAQIVSFPMNSAAGQAGTKQAVAGAALCGRPQDGQPQRVAPTILFPFCVQSKL
jgi:hypothetical protein